MDGDMIYRSELKKFYCKCCNILHSEEPCEPSECNVMVVLDEQPAVGAVEVVRCKDCGVPHNKWTGCSNLNGLVPPPDFFCAKGERREENAAD